MSDNPEYISVGVETDQASFDTLDQTAQASIDRINSRFASLNDSVASARDTIASTKAAIDALGSADISAAQDTAKAISDDYAAAKDNIKQAADNLDELTQKAEAAGPRLAAFRAATSDPVANQELTGNEQPSISDMSGDTGGGSMSLFPLARALRVGGTLTKSPALSEAGGFLYIAQAESSIQSLNGVLQETGGIVPSLTDGLVALGIPFAGILATVAPLAIVIGVVIEAVSLLTGALKDQGAAETALLDIKLQTAVDSTKTSDQIQSDRNKNYDIIDPQSQKQSQAVQDMAKASGYYVSSIQNYLDDLKKSGATSTGDYGASDIKGSGIGMSAFAQGQGGPFQAAADGWVAAQKEITKATDANIALAQAQGTSAQKAADLVDATIKHVDAQDKLTQQFAADDNMTVKAATDKADALKKDIASQQETIATLDKVSAAVLPFRDSWDKVAAAIQTHQDVVNQDTAELQHLTDTSIPAAQALKQQADATTELTKDAAEATKIAKELQSAQDAYSKSVVDAQTNAGIQIAQEQTNAADPLSKIYLDEGRKQEDIVRSTENAIEDIRTREADKEATIEQDYQNQLTDDVTKANDARSKLISTEQNKEQTDELTHEQKLADIRNSASADEEQALLDRNFLQFYKDQQKVQSQTQTEDQHFNDQRAQDRQHLQQSLNDQSIALAQLEQQQKVDEQRKIAAEELSANQEIDQQVTNEQRKQQDLQIAEDRQIQDLNTAENQKINLIRDGLSRELGLYGTNFIQRNALIQQEQTAYTAQIVSGFGSFMQSIAATLYPGTSTNPGTSFTQNINTNVTANSAVPNSGGLGDAITNAVVDAVGQILS